MFTLYQDITKWSSSLSSGKLLCIIRGNGSSVAFVINWQEQNKWNEEGKDRHKYQKIDCNCPSGRWLGDGIIKIFPLPHWDGSVYRGISGTDIHGLPQNFSYKQHLSKQQNCWSLTVGAASTTSSFSTEHLASMDWAKTTTRRDKKHLSFGIWCGWYLRFDGNQNQFTISTNVFSAIYIVASSLYTTLNLLFILFKFWKIYLKSFVKFVRRHAKNYIIALEIYCKFKLLYSYFIYNRKIRAYQRSLIF